MTKESFYKTNEEKLLKGVVDRFYNDYVGGYENDFLDYGEKPNWGEQDLIGYIVDDILSTKNYVRTESGHILEAKHFRFMGKPRVQEIVAHRVQYRHNQEGNWLWEN